jgi:peroxiredoxin
MGAAVFASRLLLFATFAVAGGAKLADRSGSRKALIDFGVPLPLAGLLGLLLPLIELAAAVALLPTATAWFGALGALGLLVLFIGAIAVNLARGRTPECHCFGQLSSAPAGRSTLVRNALLAFVAAFVLWAGPVHPGPSAVGWIADLTVAQSLGLAGGLFVVGVLVVETWLLSHLLRQQGRLVLRLETLERSLAEGAAALPVPGVPVETPAGLAVGTRAPGFKLAGLHGETATLDALLAAGRPIVLFFTNPQCGPCQSLMPEIGQWQRDHAGVLPIAVISEGSAGDNRAKSAEHRVTQVLLQKKREVADAYQASGTPGAVLIGSDGTIKSPLALGVDAVRALMTRALNGAAPTSAVLATAPENGRGNGGGPSAPNSSTRIGQPAPLMKLKSLEGQTISFEAFRGRSTLLLFWNPGCGFCQNMLDDLKAWEANPAAGSPQLLVISSGTPESNRAMNLRSPLVLDTGSDVASAFAAHGTPMAVLLDPEGRVASDVVAGAQAVMALAAPRP